MCSGSSPTGPSTCARPGGRRRSHVLPDPVDRLPGQYPTGFPMEPAGRRARTVIAARAVRVSPVRRGAGAGLRPPVLPRPPTGSERDSDDGLGRDDRPVEHGEGNHGIEPRRPGGRGEATNLFAVPAIASSTSPPRRPRRRARRPVAGRRSRTTTPQSRRATFEPRASSRATSSWPVKHPLVKDTVRSTTPTSAAMVRSSISRPSTGCPASMRAASHASTGHSTVPAATHGRSSSGGRGPSRSTPASPGQSASRRRTDRRSPPLVTSARAGRCTPSRADRRSTLVRSRKRSRRSMTARPNPLSTSRTNSSSASLATRR